MERLTFKLGNSYGLEDKSSSLVGLFTDYDGFFAYHKAVNALGKYENTGLTPQEVEKLIKENAELEARLEKSVELYEDLKVDECFIQTKFGWCFYSLVNCPLIYNLYVHPKYRRCGHSRTLLQCVINTIRGNGYDGIIQIQATPREGSIELADLEKYYESMGLVILKEREINA